MRLRVRLFGHLKTYVENRAEMQIEVPPATTLADLLAMLGIPPGEVGVDLVNGKLASQEATLADGDVVELTPALSGGST